MPAHHCKFCVSGLTPNEKYVFAVAAYTIDGQLIGNSIGRSTKPILASTPSNIMLALTYLCQVVMLRLLLSLRFLSLRFNGHFSGGPGLAGTTMSPFWTSLELRMMEVVSGDNWSYRTSPPTNQHPVFFYRPDALPVAQPTVSQHRRKARCYVLVLLLLAEIGSRHPQCKRMLPPPDIHR